MSKVFAVISLALATLSVRAQTPADAKLAGRVISPSGNSAYATVVLCYGRSKPGSQPSHLHDFPRHVQADAQGNFKVESLDPTLLYRVLVFAPGCRTKTIQDVDSSAGPLNVQLEPVIPTNSPAGTVVRGRVMGTNGTPVSGALIRILGVTRKGMTTWPAYEVDLYAVSDEAGLFSIHGETPFTDVEGAVEADGFSKALFEGWKTDDTVHEVTLVEGATFKGRVLKNREPVANAEIFIQNFGRESGSSVWCYFERTDRDGQFEFKHLPPNRSFSLYGTMESLADRGAISRREGEVHGNGTTADFGDLNLDPAFTVEGRIRLSDGKAIPSDSNLRLTRTTLVGAQDGLSYQPGEDGTFHFVGVPAEPVTLYLRISGYELSPRDRFLKSGSATNLTVVSNITDMVIQMKPSNGN